MLTAQVTLCNLELLQVELFYIDWRTDDNRELICSLIKLFHDTAFALLGLQE